MKKFIYIIAVILASAPLAYAEDGISGGGDVQDRIENEPVIQRERPMRDMMKEQRDQFKNQRQELKGEIKTNREDFLNQRKDMREEWRQTATRTPGELKAKIEEMKGIMKNRRDEIRAEIASSTKEFKARFTQEQKDNIKERITNVSGKLDSAITRMQAFDAKVEAAIGRFKARSIDTSNSEELLATARGLLDQAKANVASFQSKVSTIVTGDTASRQAFKEEVTVVIQSIKDTHAAYVAVVSELRASDNTKEVETETNN